MRIIAIILTALFLLCGCTENIPLTERYLLYIGGETLMKFNVVSGSETYVCQDPLCLHTESAGCSFASVNLFALDGETVYFRRNDYDEDGKMHWLLCTCDMTEQKVRTVTEIDALGNGYAFFMDGMYYEQCHTEEEGTYILTVNMANGRTEKLRELPDLGGRMVGDTLLYTESTDVGTAVYAADQDGSDPVCLAEGLDFVPLTNFLYEICCYDTRDEKLIRYNYRTGEKTLICDDVVYCAEFDEVIVCYRRAENPVSVGICETTGEEIFNLCGGTLWMVNAADGELTAIETRECLMQNVQQAGGCLVMSYGAFVQNNDRTLWQNDAGGRMVYDLKTGELRKFPEIGD